MKRNRLWLIPAVAALIVALVGFSLSVYVVHPGETALLQRGGRVIASGIGPGLHWKIPLVESLVALDARVQLVSARVDSGNGPESDTLSAAYVIAWRIVAPARFYTATGGDAGVVSTRLVAGITPTLRDAMQNDDAKTFLERPADSVEAALRAAATPVAKSLGIRIVGVYLGAGHLPAALARKIGQRMAAATQTQIGAVEKAGKARSAEIRNEAATHGATIIADANQKAARMRGEQEAKVIKIYAAAARKEPDFFSFYQKLESERRQLISNTKLLVISVDSPWFQALSPPAKGGSGN